MSKKDKLRQTLMFDLSPEEWTKPTEERITKWYYLASPRSQRMIMEEDGIKFSAPHDISHKYPWVTNSKRGAIRVAVTFPGVWKVKIYPYIPF